MLIKQKGLRRDDTALSFSVAENTLPVLSLHRFTAVLMI